MPALLELEEAADIRRAVAEVFDFISDPLNDPLWCPKVLSCERIGAGAPEPGARYRVVHRPIRLRGSMELELEILELRRPERVRIHERDADGTFDVTYLLEELSPATTRVTQRDRIALGIPRVLGPVVGLNIRRHLREQFRELVRVLETPARVS